MAARIILLAMILLLMPSPAAGATCGTREMILKSLKRNFDEEPVSLGVTYTGSLIEVLTSPDGGSWTIIITVPGGPTCLVSSGEGWRSAPLILDDPKA